jgi:glycosyltransferase involved in cell wall biosynthesis
LNSSHMQDLQRKLGNDMRPIALVTPHYPPLRTSTAVQILALAKEFVRQGYQLTVIVPDDQLNTSWSLETIESVNVLRLACPSTLDLGYARRAVNELWVPFAMIRGLRASPFWKTSWCLVIWWSPTIFFGPLISILKRSVSNCRTYLILRDIFPEWALDLGILNKGPIYLFFRMVAKFQYSLADTIGVQSPSNLAFLSKGGKRTARTLEVLHNWQGELPAVGSSIVVKNTFLAGRKIFLYIGNMGIAQGMDSLIDLAEILNRREDIGFLFVGRGSEMSRLKALVVKRHLSNTIFFDEVDSSEMPSLLAQCHVGLVSLDSRHKTHNIPGKFLTYLIYGLPVLAKVNPGDLAKLIEDEGVGRVSVNESVQELVYMAESMIDTADEYKKMSAKGRLTAKKLFSPINAVRQITSTIES